MRSKLFLSTLAFVVIGMMIGQTSLGQIPQTLSYQGVLTDAKGNPLPDGQYKLTFSLFEASESGLPLWSEIQTVPVINGTFKASLGEVNPLNLSFDSPYWLGFSIGDGEEMKPRLELTASPYSLTARTVADSSVTGSKVAADIWFGA